MKQKGKIGKKQGAETLHAVLAQYPADFIMSLDGRSKDARIFKARFQYAVECLGGIECVGYTAMQMVERMIFLENIVGRMESAIAANDDRVSYGQYTNVSNTLQGIYIKLGLQIGELLPEDIIIPALMENRIEKMLREDKRDMTPEQIAETKADDELDELDSQLEKVRAAYNRTGVTQTRHNNATLAAKHFKKEARELKDRLKHEDLDEPTREEIASDLAALKAARKKLGGMETVAPVVVEKFLAAFDKEKQDRKQRGPDAAKSGSKRASRTTKKKATK